ncbi:MAG: hypothetical protein IPP08_08110 [Chlorobiota bacterium]|jgi:hypothetical protein|nr:hypothetical protein [Chlorobiota bacterium]QQS65738.1 MAG: hypothetical protein IPP08_08110 [Chlorobiota bacterium]
MKHVLILMLTFLISCSSFNTPLTYTLQTDVNLVCCSKISFVIDKFKNIQKSNGEGVNIDIKKTESLDVNCKSNTHFNISISNNSDQDIYIPISNDFKNDTLQLYPWRMIQSESLPIRLARQVPYSNIVDEPSNSKYILNLLPKKSKVILFGIIKPEWLCMLPVNVYSDYLEDEVYPVIHSQQSRAARQSQKPDVNTTISNFFFRYDVAYTTLNCLNEIPLTEKRLTKNNDTMFFKSSSIEKPETILGKSYKIVKSNLIVISIK